MLALRMSLEYGGGDLRWFEALPREDQTRVLAYDRAVAAIKQEAHEAASKRAKAKGGGWRR